MFGRGDEERGHGVGMTEKSEVEEEGEGGRKKRGTRGDCRRCFIRRGREAEMRSCGRCDFAFPGWQCTI